KLLSRALDQQQVFGGRLDLAPPAIGGAHGGPQHIDTSRDPPLHQRPRDALRFARALARDQCHNLVGRPAHSRLLLTANSRFLSACRLLFAARRRATWLPRARQDTIARRGKQWMSPLIHFGTSGWRALIADEFTFDNIRLVTRAIAEHVRRQNKIPTLIVAHDKRFFSEEFARTAAEVLHAHGVQVLLCEAAAPTPAIACEILRRKTHGAINFTASHNPAEYHGLKFSGPDGGPALPEVTRDIEGRVARMVARPAKGVAESTADRRGNEFQKIDPRGPYLARLGELVNFDALRRAHLKIVCDLLHGCGAGYLDRVLSDQGSRVIAIRTERDVLFDGSGPDVSEQNLVPLRHAVVESGAHLGLATDGDADRFGIFDADGSWMSPNHILALLYDYLIESRGWRMPAARSVATTKLLDQVARHHGTKVYQTPVG